MSKKILLFGATGYTGRLTAEALVKFGAKPLLVGRNQLKLEALAKELGGLDLAVACVEDINSLSKLINHGDILISTVGPFTRYGETALQAAIEKNAHALNPRGEFYTRENIRSRLNMRDFMDTLRSSGINTGGPPPLNASDRQAFANNLDRFLAKYSTK